MVPKHLPIQFLRTWPMGGVGRDKRLTRDWQIDCCVWMSSSGVELDKNASQSASHWRREMDCFSCGRETRWLRSRGSGGVGSFIPTRQTTAAGLASPRPTRFCVRNQIGCVFEIEAKRQKARTPITPVNRISRKTISPSLVQGHGRGPKSFVLHVIRGFMPAANCTCRLLSDTDTALIS